MKLNEMILEVDGSVGFLTSSEYINYFNFEEENSRRSSLLVQFMAIFACAFAYVVHPDLNQVSIYSLISAACLMLFSLVISANSQSYVVGAFSRVVFVVFLCEFFICHQRRII
ncbi:hypothetical protein ACDW_19700 [Acidovorax sp. DW039]|uniref:hypothetical protein n=1 Tax=Acidovorax sp. DW039 TaxID=3095606 RepID=UPI0030900448|nr:hypothetical protein ACDW_19700 [Acidovorax sp. DW039]